MNITKQSILTGITHTMDIPLTEEEFNEGMVKLKSGILIQHVFPNLAKDYREFILTGATPEEWDLIFPPEEDEL